jgi:hypothetical protein
MMAETVATAETAAAETVEAMVAAAATAAATVEAMAAALLGVGTTPEVAVEVMQAAVVETVVETVAELNPAEVVVAMMAAMPLVAISLPAAVVVALTPVQPLGKTAVVVLHLMRRVERRELRLTAVAGRRTAVP